MKELYQILKDNHIVLEDHSKLDIIKDIAAMLEETNNKPIDSIKFNELYDCSIKQLKEIECYMLDE